MLWNKRYLILGGHEKPVDNLSSVGQQLCRLVQELAPARVIGNAHTDDARNRDAVKAM